MIDEFPEGWVLSTLGEVCSHPQYGWTTSAKRVGKGLKLLRTTDISAGPVDWSAVPECAREPEDPTKYLLTRGDILVARAGSVGVSYIVTEECPRAVFASYLIRFHPFNGISSEFIGLFLQSRAYWSAIREDTAGIAIPNINASKLSTLELPLPPSSEQRRIVAKVEALFAEVSGTRDCLTKASARLKRFRQSVLAAACSGRLTEDWRARHDLPASGSDGPWTTRTVGFVCEEIVDCPHSTPVWTDRGEMCLRTTNFSSQGLDLSEIRFVSPQTYRTRVARLEPRPGDVVYSREGGILGIACVIPDDLRACLGQRMMIMRCRPGVMRPRFLCHVLNSPAILERVRDLTGGTASPHLNVGDIKQFPIPVPTLEEQDEILRRADALLHLGIGVEAHLTAAIGSTSSITSAILAKAFRGELVCTEAELAGKEGRDYEPASDLLERIRTHKAKSDEVSPDRSVRAQRGQRATGATLLRVGRPNRKLSQRSRSQ